jgi:ubiquinone/menaquinone biosynthesis C-methylase UbiE
LTAAPTAETERVKRVQDKLAPKYDRSMGRWEKILFGGGREWVCSKASGDVLEIAIGTGRNLPYYPSDVRLTGVELSPKMLDEARKRAVELGHDVDLRLGDAQALEFPDETFDTVVCTFGLCTIPDERKAVVEAHRVLRLGGRFALIEHVRSPVPAVRAVEKLIEPLMVRFEADHLTREPLDHLEPVGFRVEEVHRSKWGIVERVSAVKPASVGGESVPRPSDA